MSAGSWKTYWPPLLEHTRAIGADINLRVDGLGDNFNKLPLPRDDGEKGFFGPCAVGEGTEGFHAVNAHQLLQGGINMGVESGTGDLYVVTLPIDITGYHEGLRFSFKATHTNTGATTIDVNSQGAAAFQFGHAPMPAGVISINDIIDVYFDGIVFRLMSFTNATGLVYYDAVTYAALAKQYAIGDPTEPVGLSALANRNLAEAAKVAAEASAVLSKDYSDIAAAYANFKGEWGDLTGALAIPSSVYHGSLFWMLLNDVVDVTQHVPGVDAAWAELSGGGGGGGGGLAWETSSSGLVTGIDGAGYLLDCSSSVRTLNLPPGVIGEQVGAGDWKGHAGTNSITVKRSGTDKIMGLAEDLTLNKDHQSVILSYADATRGWVIVGGAF